MSEPAGPHRSDPGGSAPPSRSTVIVVPCRNEARRLEPDTFLEYVSADPQTCFLLVDDGSTDATPRVLRRLEAARPDACSILWLETHAGKAEAVRRGVLQARQAEPAYIGYWDADLSTPLRAVDELRAALDRDPRLDIALGSRVRLLGRRIRRTPARHYLGRVFATAASLVLDLPVYDTQCGAKLLRGGHYLEALFGEPFRSRWIFDVELLARYLSLPELDPPREERIVEVPLARWEDVGGSRLRAADFLLAPLELLQIYRRYRLRTGGREADAGESDA